MYRYLHRLWPSSSTSLHATRLMNSYLKGQRRRLEKLLIIIAVESVCRAHTSIVQFTYSSVAGLTEISWLSSVYVELFLSFGDDVEKWWDLKYLFRPLSCFFYQYSHTKTIQFIKHFFAFLFRLVRDWLKHCVEFSNFGHVFSHLKNVEHFPNSETTDHRSFVFWTQEMPKLEYCES